MNAASAYTTLLPTCVVSNPSRQRGCMVSRTRGHSQKAGRRAIPRVPTKPTDYLCIQQKGAKSATTPEQSLVRLPNTVFELPPDERYLRIPHCYTMHAIPVPDPRESLTSDGQRGTSHTTNITLSSVSRVYRLAALILIIANNEESPLLSSAESLPQYLLPISSLTMRSICTLPGGRGDLCSRL